MSEDRNDQDSISNKLATPVKTLGIDPGRNGSAVLLHDRKLHNAWWWKPREKYGYWVTTLHGNFDVDGLWEVASFFGIVDCAAIEALFVGRARQTIIGTAESAGELMGATRIASGGVWERPTASRWRYDLLRLPPQTPAPQCDKYARLVIDKILGPSPAWKSGHAVDAGCIALWRTGLRGNKTK